MQRGTRTEIEEKGPLLLGKFADLALETNYGVGSRVLAFCPFNPKKEKGRNTGNPGHSGGNWRLLSHR
jgi:hypothetical protein